MPPSVLKFADIARLLGAGVICPTCKGIACRPSRWLSKEEKRCAYGTRPYRCNDCSQRFTVRSSASFERFLINGMAGVMLGLGISLAVDLWLDGSVEAKSQHAAQSADVRPADVAAMAARKQEEAAEGGDADAMLQLGRDLAKGNNRPKDVEQAAKWVQLAAATGNAEAMLELGRFYRDGVGLAQDSARAYVWLSRAAEAKHTGALLEREALIRTMGEEPLKVARELSLPTAPASVVVRPK
ncbi:MAG: hypothetical protein H6R14_1957 [Proteobacteria bacterium]|nr:hypothetical protein [Pseudomonadota bacterium]